MDAGDRALKHQRDSFIDTTLAGEETRSRHSPLSVLQGVGRLVFALCAELLRSAVQQFSEFVTTFSRFTACLTPTKSTEDRCG